MMRPIGVTVLLLAACAPPIAPTRWNGLWFSASGEGVFVYAVRDGGVAFGPHRLSALGGQMVLTQRCSDFEITSQGDVRLREGKLQGGAVSERDNGFDLTFARQPILSEIAKAMTLPDAPLDFRLEANLVDDQFTLREVWFDGGIEFPTERTFRVRKQTECVNPP